MAKRRANGEGSIFKRKDGLWAAQYTDNTGKKRTLYGKTQQIAKDKLKEAIRQSDDGMNMDKDKITFAAWLLEWLEVYSKPTTRKGTYAVHYNHIVNHLIPAFPKVLLKDLRADMLQKFYNQKHKTGKLRNSIRINPFGETPSKGLSVCMLDNINKTVSAALNQAVENQIIAVNVAKRVKLPQETPRERQVLTPDEQAKLERLILQSDHPIAFAIYLDLYTGLRVGELLALKAEDINFNTKELYVRRSIKRVHIPESKKTELVIEAPKTPKSIRTIPLPDFLVDKLRAYIDRIEKERVSLHDIEIPPEQSGWIDEGFLFFSTYGKPYESTHARRVLDKFLDYAGIEHINFHALRHTFATRAIESGFDVKSLSEILGHTDAKMTLNTYTHSLADQKRASMEKLSLLAESGDKE